MSRLSMILAIRPHTGLLFAATVLLAPTASVAQPDPAAPPMPQQPAFLETNVAVKKPLSPQEVAQLATANRFIASSPGTIFPDGHYAATTTFISGSDAVTMCKVEMARPTGGVDEWHVMTMDCRLDDVSAKARQVRAP